MNCNPKQRYLKKIRNKQRPSALSLLLVFFLMVPSFYFPSFSYANGTSSETQIVSTNTAVVVRVKIDGNDYSPQSIPVGGYTGKSATVRIGTRVNGLKTSIKASDDSNQVYIIKDINGNLKGNESLIVNGDQLLATAEDGSTVTSYKLWTTLDINNLSDWNYVTTYLNDATEGVIKNELVKFFVHNDDLQLFSRIDVQPFYTGKSNLGTAFSTSSNGSTLDGMIWIEFDTPGGTPTVTKSTVDKIGKSVTSTSFNSADCIKIHLPQSGGNITSVVTKVPFTTFAAAALTNVHNNAIVPLWAQTNASQESTATSKDKVPDTGYFNFNSATGLAEIVGAGPSVSNLKEILTFSLPGQTSAAVIDAAAGTVLINMPAGTNLSDLTATFTYSDKATVTVNGTPQISGVTSNDFTQSVTYVVKAEDGTTKNWIVTISVPVDPVPVTAISVSGAGNATTVNAGSTLQMNAVISPNNASNQNVTWSVEAGTGTASISDSGLLTGTTAGTVTVKATAQDGSGIVGSTTITIEKTTPAAPQVTANDVSNVLVGADASMEYSTDNGVSWTKYNPLDPPTFAGDMSVQIRVAEVAGVSNPGAITTLSFTANPVPVTAISVSGAGNATTVNAGSTLQMNAVVSPNTASNQNVTWSVEAGTGTASISESGLLTGTTAGTVTVKATAQDGSGIVGAATITIEKTTPAAPHVTADDVHNVLTGADATMEYSTDNGTTWTTYDPTNPPTFAGNVSVQIRVAEVAGVSNPGAVTTVTFTTNPVPVMGGSVSITGDAKVGSSLNADSTAITYTPATTADVPTYQWKRDGVNIDGATSANYTVTTADLSKTITITLSADGVHATGNVSSVGIIPKAKSIEIHVKPGFENTVKEINNEENKEFITVDHGTTAGDLKEAIEATDQSNQSYQINDANGNPKADGVPLESGDKMIVTNKDGETRVYTIIDADEAEVDDTLKNIQVGFGAPADTWESVTSNVYLIRLDHNETDVVWEASNATVVQIPQTPPQIEEAQGTRLNAALNRQISDISVIITANVSKGDIHKKRTFLIIVKAVGISKSVDDSKARPYDGEINTSISRIAVQDANDPSNNAKIDKLIIDNTLAQQALTAGAGTTSTIALMQNNTDIADEFAVEIERGVISTLAGTRNLAVVNDYAQLEISAAELAKMSKNNLDLFFRIVPVKDQTEQNSVKAGVKASIVLNNRETIPLGMPLRLETNYSGYTTRLVIPFASTNITIPPNGLATFLQSLAVNIEHSDGSKELKKVDANEATIVNDAGGNPIGISFEIDKFSTFTIIELKSAPSGGGSSNTGSSSSSSTAAAVAVEVTKAFEGFHVPYIKGYEDGYFRPDAKLTRAEMATMLARNMGCSESYTSSSYPDLSLDHWALRYIEFIREKGIMTGDPNGNFRPSDPLTRAEMAVISVKYKQLQFQEINTKDAAFPDTKDHWAVKEITAAKLANVVTGYPDGNFKPQSNIIRAEAVIVVNKLFNRGPLFGVKTATWPDVSVHHWSYSNVEEASKEHYYNLREDGAEDFIEQ